ncbi:long-chain-fatty-acid--CoA ligase [Nocardia bhagyanarayanae]|uniref:Long-chain acyl-CoA synthetase n=1 Tax=Nocardia bhagyanarayanae TaxID=1215925 RepID=A0A543EY48_9NOCA|nr:long-chain fatty acid--CoA ligase [Nocardia bhagyanarayanae]TQM26492.1 long-chain acyl-CoA synthetase [Nocardia bhagyanarayanae]
MNATLSLASILAEQARRRPDRIALIEGAQRVTFAELWSQAREQAAALIELGVRPGDRVALMCPNTAEFPRAYYAILAAGAAVIPVHLLLTANEAEHVLRDSGATLLVCHEQFAEVGRAAASAVGIGCHDPDTLVAEPIRSFVSRAPGDTAVIFYTSGTTGKPKGAELSHLNMVMNATVNAFDANDVRSDDVALGALPLFHIFGQTVSMNSTWRAGATLVLQPRFDPDEAIRLMHAEGVNTFHGVPTMYVRLITAATKLGAPQLRLCISGGASLPQPVLETFHDLFGTPILEGYGLSETSPTAAVNQPDFGPKAGTVGHAVWGVEVEIADPGVADEIVLLPPGELGEIVIRGHNVFNGYIGNPAATAAAVVQGWFRTGDLGVRDAAGYVTIADRIKDMIIRGGFNVYPSEVEEALLYHAAIEAVAVIGLPDETYGEEICAVVVAGAPLTAEQVVEFGRKRLAKHKYPRRVEFVDQLPLGPSHKVLKRELVRRYS